jgi:hypothetical protein
MFYATANASGAPGAGASSRCSLSISVVRLVFRSRAACRLFPPVFSSDRRISSRSSCDTDRHRNGRPVGGGGGVCGPFRTPGSGPDVLKRCGLKAFLRLPIARGMAFRASPASGPSATSRATETRRHEEEILPLSSSCLRAFVAINAADNPDAAPSTEWHSALSPEETTINP